ncbi:zinc finger protein 726-like [Leguminivora glycinivorella]|uniref:zinc finger protein 726-like n=1 Tax=Leguminivora glycinivorella TaxID=1035111 RepID=UPI00200D0F2F|nr:zinc finger protein 726-like [Leguminivora glycinivorella]
MDMVYQCHCCLRRPAAKDMKTPYTRLGITEIYLDMLEECFAIDATLGEYHQSGICEVCVGRLQEACHFKLQVQRSRVTLLQSLKTINRVKDEEMTLLEAEDEACEDPFLYGNFTNNTECEVSDAQNEEDCVSLSSGGVGCAEAERARQQLAMACCVRLARLRDSPRASQPCPAPPPATVQREPRTQPYTCDTCRRQFSSKRTLSTHITSTHTKAYTCECCSEKISNYSLYISHKKTHKKFICNICNKILSNYNTLTVHKRTHTGEKPYFCKYCDKGFTQLAALNAHMPQHTGIKKYNCKICNENFTRSGTLKRHHQRIHSGDKPFSCEECQKRFSNIDCFKRHKLIHSKEKPMRATNVASYFYDYFPCKYIEKYTQIPNALHVNCAVKCS